MSLEGVVKGTKGLDVDDSFTREPIAPLELVEEEEEEVEVRGVTVEEEEVTAVAVAITAAAVASDCVCWEGTKGGDRGDTVAISGNEDMVSILLSRESEDGKGSDIEGFESNFGDVVTTGTLTPATRQPKLLKRGV